MAPATMVNWTQTHTNDIPLFLIRRTGIPIADNDIIHWRLQEKFADNNIIDLETDY